MSKNHVIICMLTLFAWLLPEPSQANYMFKHYGGCLAPDSFQRVRAQKQEANIKFLEIGRASCRERVLTSV